MLDSIVENRLLLAHHLINTDHSRLLPPARTSRMIWQGSHLHPAVWSPDFTITLISA